MSARHKRINDLRMLGSVLQHQQRSINDVLLRITYADGSPSVVEYASPGRAAYMLNRYTPERYIADPEKAYAMVRKVEIKERKAG